MTFQRPTVGPKVYIARGPSGHVETFQRAHADQELVLLLGRIKVRIAVEGFIRKLALAHEHSEKWSDVIGYLGDLIKMGADDIPIDAAISFWAHTVSMRESVRKAKAEAHSKGN